MLPLIDLDNSGAVNHMQDIPWLGTSGTFGCHLVEFASIIPRDTVDG
jgi:hypothetical protein